MLQDYRQLVAEITDLTGAAPPRLLEADSPILSEAALSRADGEWMYLVGLIGGKDVGKSALVNALVEQEITQRTSFGPGTEICIAYAHHAQAPALKALLDQEVPNQYRIVTHAIDHLSRQVLLDLPDIDSHYASHIEVTQRMLKHMLFPIWMQSIEKYADARPRELLAMVAAGNDPHNFIFCLNKVDQLIDRDGADAARELGLDFGMRIGRLLKLEDPPKVWLISATHPEMYMLPDLRALLGQQKSAAIVDQSRKHALLRQGKSLAEWVGKQDLDNRLESLDRLAELAEGEIADRIGSPLVDVAIPKLLDDPAYRLALADELMNQRVIRWPIVNVFHLLLSPLLSLVRRRLPVQQQMALAGPEELVDAHLHHLSTASDPSGKSVASLVQSTFATLQQSSPQMSRLYAGRKLWESLPAELAEADLRRRMSATVKEQRAVIRSSVGKKGIGQFVRTALTIGALLWFPFIQPLLQALLTPGHGNLPLLVVEVFGVNYLLKNVSFLGIYFAILWLILKWDTQRRVDSRLERWKEGEDMNPDLSLPDQVLEWTAALLGPIRSHRQRLEALVAKAGELRQTLSTQAA
jgi:hypothetical protein